MMSSTDDEIMDLLAQRDHQLTVRPFGALRRPTQSRIVARLARAALAIVLLTGVVAGWSLSHRRDEVGGTIQRPVPAPAPTPSDAFGLLVASTGNEIEARSEVSGTVLRTFEARTYAISPDGRKVAYWRTGPDDALPHDLHVLDLVTRVDRVVVSLATERAGSAGWMVWSADSSTLAFAAHSADSAFEGRLAPHLPSSSVVRILELGTGKSRAVIRTNAGWLMPVAWNATAGQLVAVVRGTSDHVSQYLVRDLAESEPRTYALPLAVAATSLRSDDGGRRIVGVARSSCPIGTCGTAWVWPAADPAAAIRVTASDVSAASAVFRPHSDEVYAIVRDDAGASVIQRWSPSARPAQVARLPALGRLLFRPDGSALIATQTDLNSPTAYLIDPSSGQFRRIAVSSDPVASVAVR